MPVVQRVFTDAEQWALGRCGAWNGYKNLAQIAHELMIEGPEFGTAQWNEVGNVFITYFGHRNSLCCHAKRDWETIGNIWLQFADLVVKKKDIDTEVAASS